MTRLGIAVLALVASGLAAVVALELGTPEPRQPSPAKPVPTAAASDATAPPVAPDNTEQWAATILARPLFEPNRRPPAERVVAAAAATQASLPRVTGVLVGPNGKSVIFAANGNERPVVAVEGTRIGVYTVQSIKAGEVTVMGPDGPRTLHPSFDGAARAGAAPSGGVGVAGRPATPAPGRFGLPSLPGLPALPIQPGTDAPPAPGGNPLTLPGLGLPGLPGAMGLPGQTGQPGPGTSQAAPPPVGTSPPTLANPAQAGQEAAR